MTEAHAYLALKLAQELYRKPPDALDDAEKKHLRGAVLRQAEIERRILATPEAASVVLPASSMQQRMAEIRGRYPTHEEFVADLERAGCDQAGIEEALARDLRVEAVLDSVAHAAEAVSDTEIEIFYLLHSERFKRPERRRLRHILITINDTLAGSEREAARRRIEEIRERLLKAPARFAEQAQKHSECPTAMNGGLIGEVARGQLFAEIEPPAFALAPGELSAVVESPLGFHLLRCDTVEPAGAMPLAEVRAKLRTHLEDARRRALQKDWIAGLFRMGGRLPPNSK